ncbi:hypothetical protein ACE414_17740 [Alteromonas macleodii]|uniref:hypothetical protein n=1 Tax=Alteromonas macleodii TaxID=28108 RepID=UPI0036607853
MEEIGNGVDGRLHHGDQTANQDVTREHISHGEGHCKMGEGERYRFDQRLVAIRAMVMDKQF